MKVTTSFEVTPVVHKKTGNIYYMINQEAIECTNSREGAPVIVYFNPANGLLFTREATEFSEKFEPVNKNNSI